MTVLHLILDIITMLIRLISRGGVRPLMVENLALHQQLIVMNRHQKRSPKLTSFDRVVFGLLSMLIQPARLAKVAIVLKPSALLKFHQALVKRKYRDLFSAKTRQKPGLKGPDQAIINAILEMKRHNPRFGYRRIAMQIALAFGIEMDKDTVRRVLNRANKHPSGSEGPSWLTFIGHAAADAGLSGAINHAFMWEAQRCQATFSIDLNRKSLIFRTHGISKRRSLLLPQ